MFIISGITIKIKFLRLGVIIVTTVIGLGAFFSPYLGQASPKVYSAGEIGSSQIETGRMLSIFGRVDDARRSEKDIATTNFNITALDRSVSATYTGLLPDKFSDDSGILAFGSFNNENIFVISWMCLLYDEKLLPLEAKQFFLNSGVCAWQQ